MCGRKRRIVGKFEITSALFRVEYHMLRPHIAAGVSDHIGILRKTFINLNKQILGSGGLVA